MPPFTPHHLDGDFGDFDGNGALGRVMFLPGSAGRAREIASQFTDVQTKTHPRGHDLHLGKFVREGRAVDVGAISTGMGCPSVEIIMTELVELGARAMIRVGTAGSIQPWVRIGDVVVATAAVRDDGASLAYLPKEFPAVASYELISLTEQTAATLGLGSRCHVGIVHSKDALYGREFGHGPQSADHLNYGRLLREGGVLATEMECSMVFTLASIADQRARVSGGPRVHAGAVLAILGDDEHPFAGGPEGDLAIKAAIDLSLQTAWRWAAAHTAPA